MLLANATRKILYINSIAHEGKVVLFGVSAIDGAENAGQIWYTVKQDGFEDSFLNTPAESRTGWENWEALQLPNEENDDQSVVDREKNELTDKESGEFVLRSVYRSSESSALAPVQLVSALGFIYVFRQSIYGTLLVDRFVLDGMTNELVRKLDVRFKRSKQKHVPYQKDERKKGGMRALTQVDSLDFRDADGNSFFEPTTDLCLVKGLVNGWFSVALVPTVEHDRHRWHIFAYDNNKEQVEIVSIRSSVEGLFDVRDEPSPGHASGIIRRTLNLRSADGTILKAINGFAAVKYDIQKELMVKGESQYLREATRILLAIPTDDGNTAAFSFSIAGDGTLAQITENIDLVRTWRVDRRNIILPLNTLEEIKAIGDESQLPQGAISKLRRGDDDRVIVSSDQAEGLKWNNNVEIQDTSDYNGHYTIDDTTADTFIITPKQGDPHSLGQWKQLEDQPGGEGFDGMITAYERIYVCRECRHASESDEATCPECASENSHEGKLKVTCESHGLGEDDEVEVQIVDTAAYNAVYRVIDVHENDFTIERKWQPGEAVNVIKKARKRRGTQFDGIGDYIEIPDAPELSLDTFTIEAWVYPDQFQGINNTIACKLQGNTFNYRLCLTPELRIQLNCYRRGGGEMGNRSRRSLKPGVWNHIAVTWNSDSGTETIFLNGDFDYLGNNTSGVLMQNSEPLLVGKGKSDQLFSGKIADLRIWNRARTEKEIKDSMYLRLTGMETGLVGYWRLGAIAEGRERKIVDFSVNENDGVVHGDPFVSEESLNRKLNNGLEATRYSNDELFAVSQGAEYIESFEFRLTHPSRDPAPSVPADLFKFSYWGKKNRDSEKRIPELPSQENPFNPRQEPFGEPINGWYTASCQFTTPNDVSLIRAFGISDIPVGGDWDSIEIRKHRIQWKSNSITEEQFVDDVLLTTLTDDKEALTALKELGRLEKRAGELLKEKRNLQMLLSDDEKWIALIADKQKQVLQAEKSLNEWNAKSKFYEAESKRALLTSEFTWTHSLDMGLWTDYDHSTWHLKIGTHTPPNRRDWYPDGKKIPDGLQDTYYDGCASFDVKTIGGNTDAELIKYWLTHYTNDSNSPKGNLDTLRKELVKLVEERKTNPVELNSRLEKINTEQLANHISQLAPLTTRVLTAIVNARKATHAMPSLHEDGRGLKTKGALLGFVRPSSRINALETSEGNVQLSYFDAIGCMRHTNYDVTADIKNRHFEEWLPDGLRSCVNFNQSKGGLVLPAENSLALPEASTIEVWVSFPLEGTGDDRLKYWRCLAGSEDGKDGYIVAEYNTATDADLLGIRVDGEFRSSGYDLTPVSAGWHHLAVVARRGVTIFYLDGKKISSYPTADKLESVRKVEKDSSLDARKLVETRQRLKVAKSNQDQQAIQDATRELHELEQKPGIKTEADQITAARVAASTQQPRKPITNLGAMTGAKPFGKVAELRIWSVALTEEEIEVNSKSVLSGNEPDLLAYYPMDGASGDTVHDKTGNGHTGTVKGLYWWGCAAPIGNLGHRVMQLDGVNDHIVLPELEVDFSSGMTVEMWVRFNKFNDWSRLIDLSNGGATDRIYLCEADSFKTLQFVFVPGADAASTLTINALGVLELGQWIHLAATIDNAGDVTLYKNGQQIQSGASGGVPSSKKRTKNFIGKSDLGNVFDGQVADVRLWNKARSQAEIKAVMNRRLTGKEPGLAGYWPLNGLNRKGEIAELTGGLHGSVTEALMVSDNTLPIVGDAVISAEYSTFGQDPETGQKTTMMRRFLAAPTSHGIQVLPDKRIEMMELKWIGNAQFAPTLLGYIEGAPPAPSENLTEEDDYNGATSVELSVAEDVALSWNRAQDTGWGSSAELFAGAETEVEGGFAIMTRLFATRAGFKGDLKSSHQQQNESSVSASSSVNKADKLELRGTPETEPKFPHLGRRFIPKNVGYALVVSALADVFITRLKRTRRMVSQLELPVENIPPDVNTITFLINPTYTMSGSLDGMTGSSATSNRFFKHVPEMRAQCGSLHPASYYRLQEAYDLKEQIDLQDKNRESYFAQFNAAVFAKYIRSNVNDEINRGNAPKDITVTREGDKLVAPLTDDEKKRAEEEALKKSQQELAEGSENQSEALRKKRSEIDTLIADQDKRKHALGSLEKWQIKMQDILIRAGKRNLVNTYVWDADGGLRTEAQSFANTVEHVIGGAFTMEAAFGGEGKFNVAGASVELTAQATTNLTETMSKTESRSTGISLNVDVSGVESRGITDYKDYPLMPGEKVDRYRFMSFYLEASTKHFNDFFNYVVDPEWLASNDEEARALRKVQGKANKTWRILHRVTYVERPALMGFGRDMHPLPKAEQEMPDNRQLQDQIDELKKYNDDLSLKIDRILSLLGDS